MIRILPEQRTADVIDLSTAPAPAFANLGRRKAYEEVADAIRQQILSKRLVTGQRLPTERDLATQFGVSRMAVREAVRSLEREGMLYVRKGSKGGLFVAQSYDRPVTDSIVNLLAAGDATLENLFEARLLIEPWCALRACELATDEEIEALGELSCGKADAGADEMRVRNLEFHRSVIRASRNPVLTIVGEAVLAILSERIKGLSSPATSREALAKHETIYDAIRLRKAQKAQSLMALDIHATGERFAKLSPERRLEMAGALGT